MPSREEPQKFVAWSGQHITGDEISQSGAPALAAASGSQAWFIFPAVQTHY